MYLCRRARRSRHPPQTRGCDRTPVRGAIPGAAPAAATPVGETANLAVMSPAMPQSVGYWPICLLTVHPGNAGGELTRKKRFVTADNVARFPGESRGPPLGGSSGGQVGPGFRRDSGPRTVFIPGRGGDAGGELKSRPQHDHRGRVPWWFPDRPLFAAPAPCWPGDSSLIVQQISRFGKLGNSRRRRSI